MILSQTVLLGRTHTRRCVLRSADAERTVCGRRVDDDGKVVTPRQRTVPNCPDCWAAMPFVTGH